MIAIAKQNGCHVEVWDENGNYIFSRFGELHGFTAATVSVKNGSQIEVWDENGNLKFTRFA